MLSSADFLFYFLGLVALLFGLGVVLFRNPIYSALCLVITMIAVAGIFGTLDAWFIAGVQLIVYAGAVTVLFVMVLMLFDLKHEMKTFSKGVIGNGVKLAASGVLLGMLGTYIWATYATEPTFKPLPPAATSSIKATRDLATSLFTNYIFSFEVIGILLLVIAVGAVTLSLESQEAPTMPINPAAWKVGLDHYLYLSALLFVFGMLGVLMRRNVIVILMCIELMLNAVNISFIAFSRYSENVNGQVMVFFVMTIAAAEAAVCLALAVTVFKKFKEVNIRFFEHLKG